MATEVTDVIEKTIGSFGRHQAQALFLVLLGFIPAGSQLYSYLFLLPKVDYICLDDNANNATNRCPCDNPQYDESVMLSSVTSEWNLICDRTILASLAQSMVQLGSLPGNILCGYLSDRYGRKLTISSALLVMAITVSVSAIAPNIWTFIAIRLVNGIASGGIVTCTYVYVIELTGPSFRTFANISLQLSNIFSLFVIALIAYYIREWRYIQIITGAPGILAIVLFWILPESPRWLITVGRTDEAIELLTKGARRNGLPTDNIAAVVKETRDKSTSEDIRENHGSFIDLFKTPKLRVYSISVALIWLIIDLAYYGINQFIGHLQGDLFINTMLSALSLTPSVLMFLIFTKYLKRRLGLILSLLIVSVSMLIYILTPDDSKYLNLMLMFLGLMGSYSGITQMHLYASELFPTIVRNSGVGFGAMGGKMGSFLAPFAVNIGIEWVTITIFIATSVFAIAFFYLLPETKDVALQNTIEEAENFAIEKKMSHKRTSNEYIKY